MKKYLNHLHRGRPAWRNALPYCLILALTGCSLPNASDSNALQILVRSDTLTLTWNPSSVADSRITSVSAYRIFCRRVGAVSWSKVAEVPASVKPSCTVSRDEVGGNGQWEFAVQAVAADGRVSPLHSSLDRTADPISGWYVHWVRSGQ